MIKVWLDFVGSVAFNACVFICVFEGARRIGAYGIHRAAVIVVVLGGIFALLNFGFSYWKYDSLNKMTQTLSKNIFPEELPADWGNQLAPEHREESSLAMARMAFVDSGRFRSYFDKSGERRQYSPTEEDIKNRDYAVVTKARLEDAIRANLADALSWLIWAITAAAFGFGIGRYKPTLSATPSLETDESKGNSRESP